MLLMAVKWSRKPSGCVITLCDYFCDLEDSAFTAAVERNVKFLTTYVKGLPSVNNGIL